MGRLLGAFVVCALVVAAPAHAKPGQLDRSFSGDGQAEVSSSGPIAGDPDGGVTLVQSGAPNAVHRLTPAGTPDPHFGTGGAAPIPSTLTDVQAVAIDGQGRVVLSGFYNPSNVDQEQWHPAVIRLTADGRPDPGFAGGLGLRADAHSALTVPLVSAGGDMGWGYQTNTGFRLVRIGSDGSVRSTRDLPIRCAPGSRRDDPPGGWGPGQLFGSPTHLRSIFGCVANTTNTNFTGSDRTIITRPDTATPVVVPGLVQLATASGTGYIVVRTRVGAPPSPGRVRLERLTSTGTVSWRLNLARLVSDISSLVSDDRGGAYVSARTAPLPAERSCLDGAVLHITSRGKIDRAFGRHGLVRLPAHDDTTMRGAVPPELATTRNRLYVKYGDIWCQGTTDRDGPYTLQQAVVALRRR